MLTATLIRFLDRLVIADKSFACLAKDDAVRFLAAADASVRFPARKGGAQEGGLFLSPADGSTLAERFPTGLLIPDELSLVGIDAMETLAYDQALLCSCSLRRADPAPFEKDFLLEAECEAVETTARIYFDTLSAAHPDELPEPVLFLRRLAFEKPAELSPLTLFEAFSAAGADTVLLFHSPETGTIVAQVAPERPMPTVFDDYAEAADAYGARIVTAGFAGRLVRGFSIEGNTVRLFSEDALPVESQDRALSADALRAWIG